jgi:LemA protein
VGAVLTGCGSAKLQEQDDAVKAAWSEVLNQYQRRADLVPNLVTTVSGFAAENERELASVSTALAKAGAAPFTPEILNNPKMFANFEAAQAELTASLQGLSVAAGNLPGLESDMNFRDLQAQLASSENLISAARHRYIAAAKAYNSTVGSFPTNMTAGMFDFDERPTFQRPDQ